MRADSRGPRVGSTVSRSSHMSSLTMMRSEASLPTCAVLRSCPVGHARAARSRSIAGRYLSPRSFGTAMRDQPTP